MAGRRSGADFHNSGPCSYLDEVPFKINDKFRSPAKVGLPVGFCLPDCASLLAEIEYDFSLERRTVRWGAELEEARAAQERARLLAESASAELERQAASLQDKEAGPSNTAPAHPMDNKGLPPPAINPVLAALKHNAILTPLPAPSLGPVRHPSPPPPQSLNLADFEREEDPFDKLELKTLDDKEELRNILQVQVVNPAESEAKGGGRPSTPLAKADLFHKPNGLVGVLDLEKTSSGSPCNIRSLTFPKLSDSAEPRDHAPTPPRCLPNGTPPLALRGRHAHGHSEALTQPLPLQTTTPAPPPECEVAPPRGGALLSLSPSERQCVETIVSMGYPYEGVLKAMQRRGQNMEQVLDYLFVHSRLCERGFDASAVEEGLEMYQCSEEKALQFLQLVSRFGEMGFEREAIKEVLLAHNNDQDKALEALMTRAATS